MDAGPRPRNPDVTNYTQIMREVEFPLRLRIRMRLHDLRGWWGLVWCSRGFPLREWRTRYRGVKFIIEQHRRDVTEALDRRLFFGE